MKYYSDILHSLFDTQDALEKAEAEKKKKDEEEARQKEVANQRKAEDKRHFLELREKYFKASDEYEAYFDKLLNCYPYSTIMSWKSEAATKKDKTTDKKVKGIFSTCKTVCEPENLGEILIRIFEDMR